MSGAPTSPHQASPAELEERVVAEHAGDPFILYRDGHGRQRMVTLAEGFEYTIGRNPDTDIPIAWDEQVSGLHAELRHAGGNWLILDDGLSRNGTRVNGESVQGHRRLRDADQISLGQTGLTYRDPLQTQAKGTVVASEKWEP